MADPTDIPPAKAPATRTPRRARKKKALVDTKRQKEFLYRGYAIEELVGMPVEEQLTLVPSRARRFFKRMNQDEETVKFWAKVQKASEGDELRTHLRAVPFRVHKTNIKHRKGGIGPGKFPVSVAAAMLRILNDAASNAEYKGLDPETMYVWHAAAHRGAPIPGTMPRAQGRATAWDKSTSHIEIVLRNKAEKEE